MFIIWISLGFSLKSISIIQGNGLPSNRCKTFPHVSDNCVCLHITVLQEDNELIMGKYRMLL